MSQPPNKNYTFIVVFQFMGITYILSLVWLVLLCFLVLITFIFTMFWMMCSNPDVQESKICIDFRQFCKSDHLFIIKYIYYYSLMVVRLC